MYHCDHCDNAIAASKLDPVVMLGPRTLHYACMTPYREAKSQPRKVAPDVARAVLPTAIIPPGVPPTPLVTTSAEVIIEDLTGPATASTSEAKALQSKRQMSLFESLL